MLGFILKLPQIDKIFRTRSVAGINPVAYYFELIMSINDFGIGKHLNLPFSVYAENLFIGSQCALITLLIWKYNMRITFLEKVATGLGIIAYAAILL